MLELTITTKKPTYFKRFPKNASDLKPEDKCSVDPTKFSKFYIKYAYDVGEHYWVKLDQALPEELSTVGKVGYFYKGHVNIDPPEQIRKEIRGVWLCNPPHSTVFDSAETIEATFKKLSERGFDTIYPVVWNGGSTLYPSEVAKSCGCKGDHGKRDLLREILDKAKIHGFRVIPWFEYGLMVPTGCGLANYARENKWLTKKNFGLNPEVDDKAGTKFVWLNVCNGQVQDFMVRLITELVKNEKYQDIDGIQLDDHFGFLQEFGHDDLTTKLYKCQTKKVPPTKKEDKDINWCKWKCEQVTKLLDTISSAVKAVRKDCLISISPNPLGFSMKNSSADWKCWVDRGLVDEIVLQLYGRTGKAFQAEIEKCEVTQTCHVLPLIIGLSTGTKEKGGTSDADLANYVKQTREANLKSAGFSFFFNESLLNKHFNKASGKWEGERSPSEFEKIFGWLPIRHTSMLVATEA